MSHSLVASTKLAKFFVGDRVRIHPEAIDSHFVRRRFLRIVVIRSHQKCAAGIHTMFSSGGFPGVSDCACSAEVMVTLLLITSSSLSSKPIFLSSIHQNSQREVLCHFDQREKSFLDPSHSLGMTVLVRHRVEGTPSTQRIAQAEVCLSKNRNPVYWTLVQ